MPVKFNHRAMLHEMIDSDQIPEKEFFRNLRELDFLNRHFGGHNSSLAGIKKLVTQRDRLYHITDIGCGGGDTLKCIAAWARKNYYRVKLTGVDVKQEAIRYLGDHCSGYPEIRGICEDYRTYLIKYPAPDVVHCSLFCHHLTDDELVWFFRQLKKSAGTGFVINDIRRTPWAYYGSKLLTTVFNGSELSKNDGPVSVLRAFKEEELRRLLQNAGISNYELKKMRFFRFLIVGRTDEKS